MPVPFAVVTTFKTAGMYKKWQWPNSAHITYAWHALVIWYNTSIHIYIYIYRTSSNLYTPDSVSLASLARQLLLKNIAVCVSGVIALVLVEMLDDEFYSLKSYF